LVEISPHIEHSGCTLPGSGGTCPQPVREGTSPALERLDGFKGGKMESERGRGMAVVAWWWLRVLMALTSLHRFPCPEGYLREEGRDCA
jgi:hypothetical protein